LKYQGCFRIAKWGGFTVKGTGSNTVRRRVLRNNCDVGGMEEKKGRGGWIIDAVNEKKSSLTQRREGRQRFKDPWPEWEKLSALAGKGQRWALQNFLECRTKG